MSDVLGFLTVQQWLALLRIGIGLWWVKSVLHKPLREFVSGDMVEWTISLAENHPVPAFGRLIKNMVAPNASWFPYLIVLGEAAVGIGLVLGLLTPVSLVVALFLNLNYISLAGVRPKDISVNKSYQCEQGQNWNMMVAELVLLFTGAWSVWSLDSVLGLFGA